MSHCHFHSQSSARQFGGKPQDYQAIHQWFDETKAVYGDAKHRALRHHSFGIFECEKLFGYSIKNSDGKEVPVRLVAEQHVREDCGGIIPSVQDWLEGIPPKAWHNRGYGRALAVQGVREEKDLKNDQPN